MIKRLLYIILWVPIMVVQSFYALFLLLTNLVWWIWYERPKYSPEELERKVDKLNIDWLINVD